MRIIFGLLALLFWIAGVVVFAGSKGAVHEIEGLILILTGMVSCCAAALLGGLYRISDIIEKNKPPAAQP